MECVWKLLTFSQRSTTFHSFSHSIIVSRELPSSSLIVHKMLSQHFTINQFLSGEEQGISICHDDWGSFLSSRVDDNWRMVINSQCILKSSCRYVWDWKKYLWALPPTKKSEWKFLLKFSILPLHLFMNDLCCNYFLFTQIVIKECSLNAEVA